MSHMIGKKPSGKFSWGEVALALAIVAILAAYAYGWSRCIRYTVGDMPGVCLLLVSP